MSKACIALALPIFLCAPRVLFAQQPGTACEHLTSVTLSNATVTSAALQAAGAWMFAPGTAVAQDANAPVAPNATMLPAFCRVAVTMKPSSDSDIQAEVWLPVQSWNGKFQAVGNGGWAGIISYQAMAYALEDGYATASTDTGHKGGNALFAIGHPEKLADLGERSVHELALKSKAVIDAFYGRAPRLSYWNGCSTGGRQGLMEAQKYPDDFDGIVAGAPANNWAHMHAWDMTALAPVLRDPAGKMPASSLALVNRAATAACDGGDGITDGIISNPKACTFDPASLQCHASAEPNCLTAPQIESVKRMYAPLKDRTGRTLFPGKERGSEPGWTTYLASDQPFGIPVGSFQVAHNDPSWDPRSFDIARDLDLVEQKISPILDATNPNLRAFKAHGGKLLLYHGWADNLISPQNTITYYSSVLEAMPGKQDDFIRLFMIPGMLHCGGGPGPNQASWMSALERWREGSTAPSRIEAEHVNNNRVDITRPLCPYPQISVYNGAGSTNDAANFSCKAP
jgi:feruloyl esterase